MSDLLPVAVIDVGNTVLHWGYSEDGQSICENGRVSHNQAIQVGQLFLNMKKKPSCVVVASVNPRPLTDLNQGLSESLNFNFSLLEAGKNWHPKTQVDRPYEVGVDRLLNARALAQKNPQGGIVVDHGTALTIDYVAPGGIYSGGTIVPGIALATRSLSEQTALLPQVIFEHPSSVVGTNTADCIRSGLYYGFVGLVEAIVKRIRYEKGEGLPVFVTGGDASFIVRESCDGWSYCPHMTLEGLLLASHDAGIL